MADKTEQELADEFYMMEGQCISQWAATDEVLFLLCHRVLRCAVEHAAIVYFRTPTIDARLSLVSDLIGSVIPNRGARVSTRIPIKGLGTKLKKISANYCRSGIG